MASIAILVGSCICGLGIVMLGDAMFGQGDGAHFSTPEQNAALRNHLVLCGIFVVLAGGIVSAYYLLEIH